VMAQAELGDELGYDYFWAVEHHFQKEFSHCSAPEVLYGAISQRTNGSASGTRLCCCPTATTTPFGSLSGRRYWTS
jgi:alkanesulfonate monooxygenase SsuD/methylene tetrahydromethanopterin reductase-like flavin-dependent oxidoreductase (luciferase family)